MFFLPKRREAWLEKSQVTGGTGALGLVFAEWMASLGARWGPEWSGIWSVDEKSSANQRLAGFLSWMFYICICICIYIYNSWILLLLLFFLRSQKMERDKSWAQNPSNTQALCTSVAKWTASSRLKGDPGGKFDDLWGLKKRSFCLDLFFVDMMCSLQVQCTISLI